MPADRIQLTGDESIELAYEARPRLAGNAIGVNFRLRTSAETSDRDIEITALELADFLARVREGNEDLVARNDPVIRNHIAKLASWEKMVGRSRPASWKWVDEGILLYRARRGEVH